MTQLEHAIRAKEREVSKAKEDRDAGRAAERERAKVWGKAGHRCFQRYRAAHIAPVNAAASNGRPLPLPPPLQVIEDVAVHLETDLSPSPLPSRSLRRLPCAWRPT